MIDPLVKPALTLEMVELLNRTDEPHEERILQAALMWRRREEKRAFIPCLETMTLFNLSRRGAVIFGARPPLWLKMATPVGVVRIFEYERVPRDAVWLLKESPIPSLADDHDGLYERLIAAAEGLMDIATAVRK